MKDEKFLGEPLWSHMGGAITFSREFLHIRSILLNGSAIPDPFFGERKIERKDLVLQRNLVPPRSFLEFFKLPCILRSVEEYALANFRS